MYDQSLCYARQVIFNRDGLFFHRNRLISMSNLGKIGHVCFQENWIFMSGYTLQHNAPHIGLHWLHTTALEARDTQYFFFKCCLGVISNGPGQSLGSGARGDGALSSGNESRRLIGASQPTYCTHCHSIFFETRQCFFWGTETWTWQ